MLLAHISRGAPLLALENLDIISMSLVAASGSALGGLGLWSAVHRHAGGHPVLGRHRGADRGVPAPQIIEVSCK